METDRSSRQQIAPGHPELVVERRKVEKLIQETARWVAANGVSFEDLLRQSKPNDALWAFLHDESCSDARLYRTLLQRERHVEEGARESSNGAGGSASPVSQAQRPGPAKKNRRRCSPGSSRGIASPPRKLRGSPKRPASLSARTGAFPYNP